MPNSLSASSRRLERVRSRKSKARSTEFQRLLLVLGFRMPSAFVAIMNQFPVPGLASGGS